MPPLRLEREVSEVAKTADQVLLFVWPRVTSLRDHPEQERVKEKIREIHEIPGKMGVSSPKNEQENMELVSLSELRRLYPDYAAWLAACRDNPGASSSYHCPVSVVHIGR